ncbi:MAG: FKBP-type peptidyl-prolyl cis-trans isomerase [Anaerolineae bacterium]|nr:FKBP-type peptidyl-prolyl cis-trans isomerase [Anaerolineae bacterium]
MAAEVTSVKDGVVVELVYTLCLETGEFVDSCEEHEALTFIQGSSGLVDGFTEAIYGLKAGEEKEFTVPPELGYGEFDPEAHFLVPLDAFPDGEEPKIGAYYNVETEEGDIQEALVEDITDEGALLDFNHVFAGESLHFTVRLLSLREPTAEELAHGHAHGGQHHH